MGKGSECTYSKPNTRNGIRPLRSAPSSTSYSSLTLGFSHDDMLAVLTCLLVYPKNSNVFKMENDCNVVLLLTS